MSENQRPADTRSASQKIQDLENGLMSLYQTADSMARDLMTAKEVISLLGNKIDAIVKASGLGQPLTDDVISRIMVENNCEKLAERVKLMTAQGIIVPSEQINDNSFVVGCEVNEVGEVTNPRYQFALVALPPQIRARMIGGRVGDLLNLQEGTMKFKVNAVYDIQQPKAPEAAPAAPEAEVAPDQSAAPATA